MAFLAGAGLWRIGLAVGWLVGAWLFGPKQSKNDIFDPGAEEMPRWNTSLRGITMPVAFGTNRISSQMCWQHDYNVTRKEDGGGGGKFGGSGGGKAAQQSGITYDYKWDMIFHLAMVPTKVNMFKGWLGATVLNDDTINAIITSTAGTIEFVDSGKKNSQQDKVSMKFEDAFFYKGSGPGLAADDVAGVDAGWTEVLADEGIPIRWPHTSWLGFKQLDLGQSPQTPQLSFEIGPGAVTVSDTSKNMMLKTADTQVDSSATYARHIPGASAQIKGEDGKTYVIVSQNISFDSEINFYEVNFDTNTVTFKYTKVAADWAALAAAAGISFTNTDGTLTACKAAVLDPFPYFMVLGYSNTVLLYHYVYALYLTIGADGQPKLVGGGRGRHNIGTPTHPNLWKSVALCGQKLRSSPIVAISSFGITSTSPPEMWIFPAIDDMTGGVSAGVTAFGSTYDVDYHLTAPDPVRRPLTSEFANNFANHGSYREYTSFFWFNPGDIASPNLRMWYYIGPSDMQAAIDNVGNQCTTVDTLSGTYPNGALMYLDYGEILYTQTRQAGADIGSATTPTPVDARSLFVDLDGNTIDFSVDAGLYANGSTTESPNKYRGDFDPHPAVYKVQSGAYAGSWMMIFTQLLQDNTVDMINDGIHSSWARAYVFMFNPLTNKFVRMARIEFEPFDRAADLGGTDATKYYTRTSFPIYDADTQTAFFFATTFGDTAAKIYFFSTAFHGLSISGGSDVYPPYIIYEILTNPWFGLGLDANTQIDLVSYQAAIQYCIDNNFKVSVQFRREQAALEQIDDVLTTYGGFLSISNGVIKFKQLEYLDGASSPVRTIDNHHLVVEDKGRPPVSVTKGALQDTFNKIRVNYYDRDLEYAQNQVEESDEVDQDFNGIRMREYPAIFVMKEAMARTMATRALWTNLYARDTYDFSLGWKDQDLEPGDVITLQDSFHPALANGVVCRIITWKESKRGKFDVTAKQEFEYMLATSVQALAITSASYTQKSGPVPDIKDFEMYELPIEFDTVPRLYVGWATWNFAAGAELWVSADNVSFARALKVDPYQIAMTLQGGLPAVQNGEFNENVEVVMYPTSDYYYSGSVFFNTTLGNIDESGRALGASLLRVGSEMVAYEGVTLVGQNRYRFDRVYRGWGGTNIHQHTSGDVMYKHGGGIFQQQLHTDKIGSIIYYKVRPYNFWGIGPEINSITAKSYRVVGNGWLPQNAGQPRFVNSGDYRGVTREWVGSTVDIAIRWADTAKRVGYGFRGFGLLRYGAPSAYNSHAFRVNVYDSSSTMVRSLSTCSLDYTYSIANNVADNGSWQGNLTFKVTPYNNNGDAVLPGYLTLELWQ